MRARSKSVLPVSAARSAQRGAWQSRGGAPDHRYVQLEFGVHLRPGSPKARAAKSLGLVGPGSRVLVDFKKPQVVSSVKTLRTSVRVTSPRSGASRKKKVARSASGAAFVRKWSASGVQEISNERKGDKGVVENIDAANHRSGFEFKNTGEFVYSEPRGERWQCLSWTTRSGIDFAKCVGRIAAGHDQLHRDQVGCISYADGNFVEYSDAGSIVSALEDLDDSAIAGFIVGFDGVSVSFQGADTPASDVGGVLSVTSAPAEIELNARAWLKDYSSSKIRKNAGSLATKIVRVLP